MVASYRVVPYLQCCYAWVITSSAVHNYWKCYINVVTRTCSGFCWCIHTLPRALHALGSRAYISVKPLTAVLQYINVPLCMGGSKRKGGIQIWCIPEGRDTNNMYPGKRCHSLYRDNKFTIDCGFEFVDNIDSIHLNLVTTFAIGARRRGS